MWAKILEIWNSLWSTCFAIIGAVKGWILDVVYQIFDALLSVFQSLVSAIPVPSSWASASGFWDAAPGQALYLAGLLHLPLCFSVILGGYGVRFALNLIPGVFTRV